MDSDLGQIEEYWYPIEEFPDYEISNTGLIVNSDTNRIMKTSKTSQGALKVGLMGFDGKQHTRSVKVLVAEAFVGGRDEIFNTPINLDGDQENCSADNLLWRPRWFAWQYTAQFAQHYRYYTTSQVQDLASEEVYVNIRDAAMRNGLLMKDILVSCHHGKECFPTGQVFKILSRTRT
jgi:hypothetical protein